jgi:hypothetical protein
MSPRQIAAHLKDMQATLSSLQSKRDTLALPTLDPTYDTLKAEKRAVPSMLDVRTALLQTAAALSDTAQSIVLIQISYDAATRSVTVTGDVRNVGARSMTVLATLSDRIAQLSFVKNLERPAFVREGSDPAHFHSPFTLHFTL